MADIPTDVNYTKDHEWIRIEDSGAIIGITDFAQGELGDIIFVEFPAVGDTINAGDTFGTIEAVKTVADLFMPVTGSIEEINSRLEDAPEKINEDPYGEGWIVRIKITDPSDASHLLDAAGYEQLIG